MIAKLIPTIRRSVANSARCFLRSTSRSALNRPLCYRSFSSTQFHNQQSKTPKQQDRIKIDKPSLLLAFTCKKCGTRSSHIISKQAYLTGSVLVECPSCKNRHLIADHLNIFHDGKINIEQILKAKGENVSQSTQDLCFDDIPESLKDMLGPYAKDAPKDYKNKASNDQNATHKLPKSGSTDKD